MKKFIRSLMIKSLIYTILPSGLLTFFYFDLFDLDIFNQKKIEHAIHLTEEINQHQNEKILNKLETPIKSPNSSDNLEVNDNNIIIYIVVGLTVLGLIYLGYNWFNDSTNDAVNIIHSTTENIKQNQASMIKMNPSIKHVTPEMLENLEEIQKKIIPNTVKGPTKILKSHTTTIYNQVGVFEEKHVYTNKGAYVTTTKLSDWPFKS